MPTSRERLMLEEPGAKRQDRNKQATTSHVSPCQDLVWLGLLYVYVCESGAYGSHTEKREI